MLDQKIAVHNFDAIFFDLLAKKLMRITLWCIILSNFLHIKIRKLEFTQSTHACGVHIILLPIFAMLFFEK